MITDTRLPEEFNDNCGWNGMMALLESHIFYLASRPLINIHHIDYI